jgi:hypothetical protein
LRLWVRSKLEAFSWKSALLMNMMVLSSVETRWTHRKNRRPRAVDEAQACRHAPIEKPAQARRP